ncbi:MAG: DUF4160 domain-containing protein [Candidatus Electrothrix sp. AUS1_2]|nr:DUF4160 domain-containing protein [Candidatus Electrothrix sp. AUS1_2]
MPTLLNQDGFKFFFYANEHEPCHIHVMKGEGYCKVELKGCRVVNNCMKPKDLKKGLAIIHVNKDEFIRKWNEYFS